jgi:prepilin-type N-terminal cleavage/methylation domain-containing protein/prepilin-type processing-associated H-X9-DG protein
MQSVRNLVRVHRGFTLIELLVVVAIISILAAILFPVFGRARENARRSSCQSNLKQIGLGIMQYVQDYDETYPSRFVTYGTSSVYWPTLIFPYTKSAQIFACPPATSEGVPSPYSGAGTRRYFGLVASDGSEGGFGRVNAQSYSMNTILNNRANSSQEGWNTALGGNWGTSTNVKMGFVSASDTAISSAAVPVPATTIFIVDGWTSNGSPVIANKGQTLAAIKWERSTDYNSLATFADTSHTKVPERHLEGFNVLWGDGHVKWRKFGSTTPQEWSIQED